MCPGGRVPKQPIAQQHQSSSLPGYRQGKHRQKWRALSGRYGAAVASCALTVRTDLSLVCAELRRLLREWIARASPFRARSAERHEVAVRCSSTIELRPAAIAASRSCVAC